MNILSENESHKAMKPLGPIITVTTQEFGICRIVSVELRVEYNANDP